MARVGIGHDPGVGTDRWRLEVSLASGPLTGRRKRSSEVLFDILVWVGRAIVRIRLVMAHSRTGGDTPVSVPRR